MFLKAHYGIGYHMVMVKTPTCVPADVINLVTSLVNGAVLESNVRFWLLYVHISEMLTCSAAHRLAWS